MIGVSHETRNHKVTLKSVINTIGMLLGEKKFNENAL